MNAIFLWSVAAVSLVVAASTAWKLITERHRLSREELSDEDRALVWQTVFFIVFPLINLIDMRGTMVACNLLGGYVQSWTYGFLWYQVIPQGLPTSLVLPVLFAGPVAAVILALLLIPPLSFRPHPFLACLLGYSSLFILVIHLIVNPVLALSGFGSGVWEQVAAVASGGLLYEMFLLHAALAISLILIARNPAVRMWFSELTRPAANRELREALMTLHGHNDDSAKSICQIGLLYDQAGLRRNAFKLLKTGKEKYPDSLYMNFLESLLNYRKREYKAARQLFLFASDRRGVDGVLKASLLAASGCAAFAADDLIGALNLCERALEFDNASLIARMVKVDVFLRQGKREQAGDEILAAMRLGLTLELENKVPLDVERCFNAIVQLDEREKIRQFQQSSRNI
jgi:tetratricopeptide (TPR) repeat protein